MSYRNHIRIHSQCGACGQLFLAGEYPVVASTRESSSSAFENGPLCSTASIFPGLYLSYESDDQHGLGRDPIFCKAPVCSCHDGEECTTNVNGPERNHEIYRRLWLAGTRRFAWKDMIPLKFMNSTALESPPPEVISEVFGFQDVFLPEIIYLIQSFSKSHILWRLCSVLRLVRDLELAETLETVTYSLPKVLSWSRAEPLKLVLAQDANLAGPLIKFTVDSRGIKSIERISTVPANAGSEMPTPSSVFAIERVEKLLDAKIEFELGMCRFHAAPGSISAWSTPAIFHHIEASLAGLGQFIHSVQQYDRVNSISMDPKYCTGISSFMHNHVVLDIHAHSRQYPSIHTEKFKYMDSTYNFNYKWNIVWTYMPLTAKNTVTAIRIRIHVSKENPHYFTFYTETGERIVVGTPYNETHSLHRVYKLGKDERRHFNLIHSVQKSGPLTAIQPDNAEIVTDDSNSEYATTAINIPPTISSFKSRTRTTSPLPKAYFSSASLEGILNVQVFTGGLENLCKGILIEYENGTQRALGWYKPLSLHYMVTKVQWAVDDVWDPIETSIGARVTFDSESRHMSEDGTLEENYYEMKGRLIFWFTFHAAELQFVDN
ncbi:hypothetical protein GGI43DRAFT_428333 [Trichoderma evansii]